MSLERRIFYNTVAQSAGKIVTAVLGIVTIALLSRYLREEGFGRYSTAVAYLGFFATLAELGLYLIVTREISRPDTDHPKILSNALGLRLAASAAVLGLALLLALGLPYGAIGQKTMLACAAAVLFMSLNQVLVSVFQKHLVQHLLVASEAAGRLVNLILIFLFIRQSLPLPYFLLALLLGNAVNFLASVLLAKRYENFGLAFDFKVWRKLLAASWPLIFASILNLVYFRADTIVLSLFHPASTVGVYSFPYKNLEGILAFPAMFVGLIMPLLSRTAFRDWPRFKTYLQNAFDALAVMAAPIVAVAIFYAAPILDLLKGRQAGFADSPALLQILILAAAAIFFGTLFSYAVVAANKQKAMIGGYLLAAAVGLVAYFGLIPRYGYWAAAWGTVASEVIVLIYAYVLVRRVSGQRLSWHIFLKLVAPAVLMTGFYALSDVNWLLELLIGLALYVTALVVLKVVPDKFVKEIFFLR